MRRASAEHVYSRPCEECGGEFPIAHTGVEARYWMCYSRTAQRSQWSDHDLWHLLERHGCVGCIGNSRCDMLLDRGRRAEGMVLDERPVICRRKHLG